MRILVTGGAGFVGSNLASFFKRDRPDATVVAFDNLRRRGSELALPRLRAAGVEFRHGDVRNAEDLAEAGDFDLMIECSAEPSVHAGYGASPAYVINTNLTGTINCLEAVRRCGAALVFLSTSRVYPIAGLARPAPERRRPAAGAGRGSSGTGMVRRRHRHGFPHGRQPVDLWRHQAGVGTDDRGIRRDVRPARRGQPLRRADRAVADGQGRSGLHGAVGGPAPVRRRPLLYGFRRHRGAGARHPARGGPLRPDPPSRSTISGCMRARPTMSAAVPRSAYRWPN